MPQNAALNAYDCDPLRKNAISAPAFGGAIYVRHTNFQIAFLSLYVCSLSLNDSPVMSWSRISYTSSPNSLEYLETILSVFQTFDRFGYEILQF